MHKIDLESMGDVKKYIWHYKKNGVEHGPFAYEEIVELVRKGDIGPDDYLMKFGYRKLCKASEVEGLFDKTEWCGENHEEKEAEAVLSEERIAESEKESIENEENMEFDNDKTLAHAEYRAEAPKSRIIPAAAALLGLCLVLWVLTRL